MTVCADVTERKILEEKLRIAQRMEAIGQLAGGVAHDFNNLLTVINGYALMLESQPEVARLAGPELRQILHAGQRAATLTQQLLAFSRHQTVEPRPVDLTRLIRNMDAILTRLLRPDIEVEVQLADALPAVSADPTQMEQVVLNLALNAADAMPDGGRLTIGTRPSGEPRPSVVLVVRDTGSGMSQEVQSRIFEPFFTTKPAGRGTGLGLATVDRIVRQAGGTIKVVSAPGQGSEFAVSLPALPTS
ncbi:MAG: hypothetical protein IPM24_11095 [Bryobacterales bacterium]|nr:hypothetical protein [Bryobacterales bacterium]